MSANSTKSSTSIDLLYRWFGYINKRNLQRLVVDIGIKLIGKLSPYEACKFRKQTQLPQHDPAIQRAKRKGELFYIDTNGPWKMPTLYSPRNSKINPIPAGSKHFLLIINDYTLYK